MFCNALILLCLIFIIDIIYIFEMFVFLQEGVGDTADSYAYDGHRVRKWNVATGKYGEVIVVYS